MCSFRDLNCQHTVYAEIIDRFRLLNNVQIINTSVYYAINALYSETPINTFNNIQKYCII